MDVGDLFIENYEGRICSIRFEKKLGSPSMSVSKEKSGIICETKKQLTEYFERKRKVFDVPLNLSGTEFQLKVWEELRKIPYGETESYADIAKAIGNSKAVRAVGTAISKNPIPIIIPCHRVINSDGSIGGFSGGVRVKEKLLHLEEKWV